MRELYRRGWFSGAAVKPGALDGVKGKRLVRLLGIPRPYVVGLMETMWLVAHAAGSPTLGTADDVEAAAEWPGEPGAFSAALVTVRFLDVVEGGLLACHDYWQHCPKYVRDRRVAAIRRALGGRKWSDVLNAFAIDQSGDDEDGASVAIAELLGASTSDLRRALAVQDAPLDLESRLAIVAGGGDRREPSPKVVDSCREPAPLLSSPFLSSPDPDSTSSLRSDVAPGSQPTPGAVVEIGKRVGAGTRADEVARVRAVWTAEGLRPPKPGMVAGWLGAWSVDDLLAVLGDCLARGYLKAGPNYVHQVLTTARANGGRLLERVPGGGPRPMNEVAAQAMAMLSSWGAR